MKTTRLTSKGRLVIPFARKLPRLDDATAFAPVQLRD